MIRTSPIELGHFGHAGHRGRLDVDALGNWPGYVHKTNGATDFNQTRTHDLANEITQINSSSTHVAEDLAGNMTKLPKPGNWTDHYYIGYDAWNRLVRLATRTTTVAQYQYDGRNFRTIKRTYASGSLSETRHFYYNSSWQLLEERLESGGVIASYGQSPERVGRPLHRRPGLRDRDADGDSGTGNLGVTGSGLEERLYALQDPNWNVVATGEHESYRAGTVQLQRLRHADRADRRFAQPQPAHQLRLGLPSTPAANTIPKPASTSTATGPTALNWEGSPPGIR